MKNSIHRREFILNGSIACMGGCLMFSGSAFRAPFLSESDEIVPEDLCYCGYKCPDDCKFYLATVNNDTELKKEVFKEWSLGERYGLTFDPEKIFCYKCKPADRPEGPVLTNCTVRSCAVEKGYAACIQCDELKSCKKDLWERFPEFHKQVIKMQEEYRSQTT